jgi:hypothetical protein
MGSVGKKQNPLLMQHPLHLQNTGIEMVVPTLSALLSQSTLHKFSNKRPTLRAILFNKFSYQVILLLRPRFFSQEFRFIGVGLHDRIVIILLRDLLFEIFLNHLLKFKLKLI